MAEWHMKSKKKATGGTRKTHRRSTKKLAWKGGIFSETKLSEKEERVFLSGRGNTRKRKLKHALNVNLTDPSTKKTSNVKVLTIIQNDANRQFARRNIITKGAVLEVEVNGEKKHARVTSRPGQHGVINAIIIKEIEDKKKTKKKKKSEKLKKAKEDKKEKIEDKKEIKKEEKQPEAEKPKTEEKEEIKETDLKEDKKTEKKEESKEKKEEKKAELKQEKKEPETKESKKE
ncbi:30S ribosomal protein S8e [Candidatus Micrarchaeota archaeon]|nr:30S ribosomal protein S8e [Candidatus Micrarchaeota archaeon]MBU2476085.1 30S ribosomal protein S8e [Candidatus Micrarchaeota archaeon]